MAPKIAVLILALGLASCETAGALGGSARQVLHAFCTLKRTEIVQVLLSQSVIEAGQRVCAAIGDPLGTP
jgi:hypothetical protein